MMAVHECCELERLTQHSEDIMALKAKADFKEKRIDEVSEAMGKMDEKLDLIVKDMNQLMMQSNKNDAQLELRLKAIETELALQKQITDSNRNRTNLLISIVSIVFIGLTFYFNYIR